MKKIFSLLAALIVLSTSGVWAQDASTSTTSKMGDVATEETAVADLEDGYYVIQATAENHVGYIFYNGNTDPASAGEGTIRMKYDGSIVKDTIGTGGSLAYVWRVTPSADKKQLVIQCAGNGGFWPIESNDYGNMATAKTIANAAVFAYPSEINAGVRLYQVNTKFNGLDLYVHKNNLNDNEFKLGYWESAGNANGSSSACCFKFYKFRLAEGVATNATAAVPVTYTQQIDGIDKGVTITNKVTYVGTVTSPWEYSNGVFTPSFTPATIELNTGSVIVNFVSNKNPRVTIDDYHKLKFKDGYRVVVGGNTDAPDNSSKNDFVNYYNPNKYWKFVKDGLQVKMVCGDGKYVHLDNPTKSGTNKALFVESAENATKFYLNNSTNANYSDGFVLKYSGNIYLGDHASPPNHSLGTWNDAQAAGGAGSCFFVETTLSTEDLMVLSHRINVKQPADIESNVLRVAKSDQVADANNKLRELDANITPKALIGIYNGVFTIQPDANAYYRIKNVGSAVYPSTINSIANTKGVTNTRVIDLTAENAAVAPQLWQFVANEDGTYKIKNANTSCAWANKTVTGEDIDMPTAENTTQYAGNFNILAVPVPNPPATGYYEGSIASMNNGISTFLIRNGLSAVKATSGNKLQLAATDATFSENENYWQIEKVENFNVAISDARYATVGYPFPVQVTNTDVKVYYATEAENGILKLTEATNKIIPANQGAILYCESGQTKVNMKILASTDVTFANNKLTATTAKREGFTSLSTYGLSNMNGVVCFRKNVSTNVPANKAYLDANNYTSTSGSAQQLLFSFDNVVEGIDNVVKAQNANKVYYDLQGRRVLYPAHGIFVTENGEKVFIK